MTKLLGMFAILLIFLGLASNAYAQENAAPLVSVAPVDSYTLFWPIISGKTKADRFYSLKLVKENIHSRFIFDGSKKADYLILLGTKRVLEAEKLFKEGKVNLALNSLDSASANFSRSYKAMKVAGEKGKFDANKIRRDRLTNTKSLIDYLKVTSPVEVHAKLDAVKEGADAMLRDYLP